MHVICLSEARFHQISNLIYVVFQIPGEVRFLGKPGWKLWPIPTDPWHKLISYKPDVVFWCLGGNSIDKDKSPGVIYKEIIRRVDLLKQFGVKKVYVSERGCVKKCPGLTKETFDDKRHVINRRLRKKLKDEFITFPNMKYLADYDDDLPCFEAGMLS